MAGLKCDLTRISLAVRDLPGTMAAYHRAFGWSDWKVYNYVEPFQHDAELRGEPVAYRARVAEVTIGPTTFVLVEPLEGPSLWQEFIDTQGEGIVSIGVTFDTIDQPEALKREFEALGVGVTMRASLGDASEYFYLDTQEKFGCLIESDIRQTRDFTEPTEVYPDPRGGVAARPTRPNDITQVAVVVHDLDAKMKEYHKAFGWGPWKVFQSEGVKIMHHCTMDGKPSEFFKIRWAEVGVGDIIFELVQPFGGDNPWQRMIDTRGEGIGSIAVMFKTEQDSEEVKKEFQDAGLGVTSSGRIGDHIEWYYLDTEPAFKCVIESGSGHAFEFMEPDSVYPEA